MQNNTYKIFVEFPSGETIAFDMAKDAKVNNLKNSVCADNIKFEELALIFNGQNLEGNCKIAETGLANNSTVKALVGIKGKIHLFFRIFI